MAEFTLETLKYLAPELILAFVGLIIIVLGKNKKFSFALSLTALGAALVLVFGLLGINTTEIYQTLEINTFSSLLKLIFLGLSILVVLGSKEFAEGLIYSKEYYALILFATIGLMMVGSSGDLITLFIAFELTSISTYALPLIDTENSLGREAGLKYFITGAFSSGLILFGMSLVFGLTGTVIFSEMALSLASLGNEPLIFVAFAFLVAGFGYKMTLVPFHLWAPDTYTGAPSPVSAFLAGSTKKIAFVVALKLFLTVLFVIKLKVSILLGVLAVMTMTFGNAVALMQDNIKRMMAYSSVAHAGNILVGLAIFNQLAVAGSILHILAHGLMVIGAFFAILIVGKKLGGYDLEDFSGLRKVAPWTAFGLMLILLSLAGLPPFLGFWSKMVMVLSAFETGGWYAFLALALVLNSALSLVYYARIITAMYMGKENEKKKERVKEKGSSLVAVYACAMILLFVGFFPAQLVEISSEAAKYIIP